MRRRADYGIKGWDQTKVGPQFAIKWFKCPHCWFQAKAKNALTKHINENHWEESK